MKLETIQEEWEKDCKIDMSALDEVSCGTTPVLQSKYFKLFSQERLMLRKLEADMRKLRLAKHEFYTQGPCKEDRYKDWAMPSQGAISRREVDLYLDGDIDISALQLKIAYAQEKVTYLERIINTLNGRSFAIKNALEFIRWSQGG